MNDIESGRGPRRRPEGPPPGVLALIVLAFTIASAAARGLGSAGWNGFLAFAASVPLVIYAATVYARQLRLGIRVPGPGISLCGGIVASIVLATAGLLIRAAAQVAGLTSPVHHLVNQVAFLLGGAAFAAGLGLLIAGIAVPAVIVRLMPRWLGWAGLVLGFLGEASILAMLWSGLGVLLPVVRFGGLAWLAAAGFLLPRDRRDVPRPDRAAAS